MILIPILFGVDDSFFCKHLLRSMCTIFGTWGPFKMRQKWRDVKEKQSEKMAYLIFMVWLINYQTSEMNDRYSMAMASTLGWQVKLQNGAPAPGENELHEYRAAIKDKWAKQWEVSSGKWDELFQRFFKGMIPKTKTELFANIGFI